MFGLAYKCFMGAIFAQTLNNLHIHSVTGLASTVCQHLHNVCKPDVKRINKLRNIHVPTRFPHYGIVRWESGTGIN